MALAPATDLRAALDALADAARGFEFRMAGPEQEQRRRLVADLTRLTDDYLVKRLANIHEPALAVVLGSTGSGKSTLVNSLAQAPITRPGPVRPTTRRPVAWCHESNTGSLADTESVLEIAVTRDDLVRNITVVDAPDFDSVVAEHREVVEALIARADYAIYVTTAQRYADSVPWDILRSIVDRGIPLLPVINRLSAAPADGMGPAEDFTRLLAEGGISATSPLAIREQPVDALHGGLPAEAVLAIRGALEEVGSTAAAVILTATKGAVAQAAALAGEIDVEAGAEASTIDRLAAVVSQAYSEQTAEFEKQVRDGSMIRQEVLQRWNEQLGASQLFSEVGEGLGRLRGWLRRVFGGPASQVKAEAEHELAEELTRRAGLAARRIATAWDVDLGSRQLLDEHAWSAAPETAATARTEIELWFDHLAKLVAERGEGRRRVARAASYGVNAVAVLALIAVFSQTAGMTGAEVGITAGAAAVQQKLLEYVLGSAAARTLVTDAREELRAAGVRTFNADSERFDLRHLRSGDRDALAEARSRVDAEADVFYG